MKLKFPFVIALFLAAVPIRAHHGVTGFDQNKPVHLVGKVTEMDWTNPHIVIHLEVRAADGQVKIWLVNMFPPSVAKRQGYSPSSFAGTEITVDGYQATDGSNHVNGNSIIFADGKKIVGPNCFDPAVPCYRPLDGQRNPGK